MATEQGKRRALLQRENERRRSKDKIRQHTIQPNDLPKRQTQVMEAVKTWLGWPKISTKDKILALKRKDDEISDKLATQFKELEDLMVSTKNPCQDD